MRLSIGNVLKAMTRWPWYVIRVSRSRYHGRIRADGQLKLSRQGNKQVVHRLGGRMNGANFAGLDPDVRNANVSAIDLPHGSNALQAGARLSATMHGKKK